MRIDLFCDEVKYFIKKHKVLCAMTLGLAIAGYALANLAGRAVVWLSQCCGSAEKTDRVAKGVFTPQSEATSETELPLPKQDTSNPNSENPLENSQKNTLATSNPTLPVQPLDLKDELYMTAFEKTPRFSGYQIAFPHGHYLEGLVLTGTTLRPSNLFFSALGLQTTLPGSAQLFAFKDDHERIRRSCKDLAAYNPQDSVAFSAQNIFANVNIHDVLFHVPNLAEVYGTATYRMSHKEIQDTLDSQKIYVSSFIPLAFYVGLKQAMKQDNMVILPGDDLHPCLLRDLNSSKYPNLSKFLSAVDVSYSKYGFASHQQLDDIKKLTLYQLGSQVVKSEDFRIFVNGNGKIIERQPGQNDAIRLINACGIRGITSRKTPQEINKALMTETFKASLLAAEKGIVIMPAVVESAYQDTTSSRLRSITLPTIANFPYNTTSAYRIYSVTNINNNKSINLQ